MGKERTIGALYISALSGFRKMVVFIMLDFAIDFLDTFILDLLGKIRTANITDDRQNIAAQKAF